MPIQVAPTADVDHSASIGEGSRVWELAQVREDATLGSDCILGRGAYIDAGVVLGDAVKVQNYALVYAPARIGDGAFIGPAAVLTNDRNPRSVDEHGAAKTATDWHAEGVTVGAGAAIGARSVVLAGVRIGDWAMVGAGAVVTRDIPAFGLAVGCPATVVGWVGHAGVRLEPIDDGRLRCPSTGRLYRRIDNELEPE